MSEKIVQLNEEVIKGQLKELVRGSVEEMTALTPKIAIEHGIGMVHQEFMLVNELTVLENIILGFEPKKKVTIDFDKARREIQKYIDTYHMDIQPNKRINQISVGEAQRVEIIKTLYRGANILILDEPTAVLTPQECRKFFEILHFPKKISRLDAEFFRIALWDRPLKRIYIHAYNTEIHNGCSVGKPPPTFTQLNAYLLISKKAKV